MISRFRYKSQFLNQGAARSPPLCKPALAVVFHVSLLARHTIQNRFCSVATACCRAASKQRYVASVRKNLITSLFVVCGCRRSPMSAAALTAVEHAVPGPRSRFTEAVAVELGRLFGSTGLNRSP